jgi:mRNA degradation ribonuclease J1/J2
MKSTLKTYPSGRQEWLLNGKHHREDGPAIIFPDGHQHWFLHGKYHREDGPAVIWPNGTQKWYINDKDITQEVNEWAKERNIDLNNMSDEDKMVLKIELKMWK